MVRSSACGGVRLFRGGGVRRLSSRGFGVRCAAVRALFLSWRGRWAGSDRVFCWQRSGDVALRFAVVPVYHCRSSSAFANIAKKSKLQQNPLFRVGPLWYSSTRQTCRRTLTTCWTQASPRKRLFPPETRSRRGSAISETHSCHTRGQRIATLQQRCISSETASISYAPKCQLLKYGRLGATASSRQTLKAIHSSLATL